MYEYHDILVGEFLQNATEFIFELHAYRHWLRTALIRVSGFTVDPSQHGAFRKSGKAWAYLARFACHLIKAGKRAA